MKEFEIGKSVIKTEKIVDSEKKVSEAPIVDGEILANQYHGDATDVDIVHVDHEGHQRSYVVKDYNQTLWKHDMDLEVKREQALRSVEMHDLIKNAGLPTYPTYRLEKNGTAILMTNLNVDGKVALSAHRGPLDWMDEDGRVIKKIESLESFDKLLTQLNDCVKKATEAGLVLEFDTYFFLVKEVIDGVYDADLFVGDFEDVESSAEVAERYDDIEAENIECANRLLTMFVENYFDQPIRNEYLTKIKEAFTTTT